MDKKTIIKKVRREGLKGTLPEWGNQYIVLLNVIKTLRGVTKPYKILTLVKEDSNGKIKSKRVFKDWALYPNRTDWELYS